MLKQQTLHLGPCLHCDGERLLRTAFGIRHCECYFRLMTADIAPRIIRGSDELWKPSLLAESPWSVTEDRLDSGGSFHLWRHRVWRSMAAVRYAEYLENRMHVFKAEALFTYELVDVSFQRHADYSTLMALTSPRLPLLILIEGLDPTYMRETVVQQLRAVIPARRARGLATWMYRLTSEAEIFATPAVEGGRLTPQTPYGAEVTAPKEQGQLPSGERIESPDPAAKYPVNKTGRVKPGL